MDMTLMISTLIAAYTKMSKQQSQIQLRHFMIIIFMFLKYRGLEEKRIKSKIIIFCNNFKKF